MHVHASALQAAVFLAILVIVGTGWRIGAAHLSDKPGRLGTLGAAMGFVY